MHPVVIIFTGSIVHPLLLTIWTKKTCLFTVPRRKARPAMDRFVSKCRLFRRIVSSPKLDLPKSKISTRVKRQASFSKTNGLFWSVIGTCCQILPTWTVLIALLGLNECRFSGEGLS